MEHDSTDPQFDSYLGGKHSVPAGLQLSEFIKQRMEEVVMLTEAIEESPFRGQAFQRLPKHMRRRQMSHYIKRLPRRLQRPYLLSLKDGPPAPNKRPSRKYRRRPGNLLLEYNRRQKSKVWLETHIWHAKRFHMTTKWGYRLPEKPVNKSFRACYRALSGHCLLVDASYYNCIELQGPESELLGSLKRCTSAECGLTFGARMYLSGTREGSVALFHPDSYPHGVIGNVTFMWQPVSGGDCHRKIWIWVHPRMHDEVVDCFKLLFDFSPVPVKPVEEDIIVEKVCLKATPKPQKKKKPKQMEQIKLEPKNVPFVRTPKFTNKSESVTMTLLKDTLNRFRLTGPLSQAIISQAFTVASVGNNSQDVERVEFKKRRLDDEEVQKFKGEDREGKKTWWEEYYSKEEHMKSWHLQKNYPLGEYSGCSDMASRMILGLVIEDPRMRIPAKREKAVGSVTERRQVPESPLNPNISQSPIWIPEVRDEVSLTKLTTQQINEARSKKIVPGHDVGSAIPDHLQSRIPILLVQREGNGNAQIGPLGLGSGWDVIAPAGFGMPIWLSLVFRGARTGGLKETDLLRLECNRLSEYLPPDSAAGEAENREILQKLKTRYFKLPPNKRANFTKLGVLSPFYPPWKPLVRDWVLKAEPETPNLENVTFRVLRDVKALTELSKMANKLPNSWKSTNSNLDCLIPVVIECSGRGKPTDMALICLPEDEDFRKTPVEPSHLDENEKLRKSLKAEHAKRLKSLRRKRRKDRWKLKEELAKGSPGRLKWKDVMKSNSAPSEAHSKEYRLRMERLWLPHAEEVETVAESSARTILGFVVKGEFSFSRSRGLGLGYVTLPGLMEVFRVCQRNKSKVVVLVRNRNQDANYELSLLTMVRLKQAPQSPTGNERKKVSGCC